MIDHWHQGGVCQPRAEIATGRSCPFRPCPTLRSLSPSRPLNGKIASASVQRPGTQIHRSGLDEFRGKVPITSPSRLILDLFCHHIVQCLVTHDIGARAAYLASTCFVSRRQAETISSFESAPASVLSPRAPEFVGDRGRRGIFSPPRRHPPSPDRRWSLETTCKAHFGKNRLSTIGCSAHRTINSIFPEEQCRHPYFSFSQKSTLIPAPRNSIVRGVTPPAAQIN